MGGVKQDVRARVAMPRRGSGEGAMVGFSGAWTPWKQREPGAMPGSRCLESQKRQRLLGPSSEDKSAQCRPCSGERGDSGSQGSSEPRPRAR